MAVRSWRCVAAFLLVTGLGLAADLLSKHHVFASMLSQPQSKLRIAQVADSGVKSVPLSYLGISRQAAPGVRFTLSTNPGIVFGLSMVPDWAVALATVATIALVVFFFATSHRTCRLVHLAMALILAGALGNLYDRTWSVVYLDGLEPIRRQVRDFIDLSQLHYPWIFNVADVLLVAGVAAVMLHWLAERKGGTKTKQG